MMTPPQPEPSPTRAFGRPLTNTVEDPPEVTDVWQPLQQCFVQLSPWRWAPRPLMMTLEDAEVFGRGA